MALAQEADHAFCTGAHRREPDRVRARDDLDIVLFANAEVFLDPASVEEILHFATIVDTLAALNARDYFADTPARLDRVVLTPDFHRGAGIPVGTVLDARGFVLPKAVGTDIGCGMRLLATDVTTDEFARLGPDLDARLRHIFFEGGRNIPISAGQRTGIFRDGIRGCSTARNAGEGVWPAGPGGAGGRSHAHPQARRLATDGVFGLDDFIRGSGEAFTRDGQIGSIGGGNHFVEIQRIEEIFDGATARDWGLRKGTLAIMAHSGSVGIGHLVGRHFSQAAKDAFPRGEKHPGHGFYPLAPKSEPGRRYLPPWAMPAILPMPIACSSA